MENNFVKAYSIEDALKLVSQGDNRIIAGGTDLIIELRKRGGITKRIVDISGIQELREIKKQNGNIVIGAMATHSDIEKNSLIKEFLPMLSEGCSMVGSTLIRNRGTIGGNVVNSSTCGDSIPPLLIYDTVVNIKSVNGDRKESIKDFFLQKEKVKLEKNEIVSSFEAYPLKDYQWKIFKVGRRKSLAISRLTLAVALKQENGYIKDLRICPGAMLPKHSRLLETEIRFKGEIFDEKTIEKIGDGAEQEAIKYAGKRWSGEYKEPVLKGLMIRILQGFKDGE